MSDSLTRREDSLLEAATAANALLWCEYQRSQAELHGLRKESQSLSKEVERARKHLDEARKRPLRLLLAKLRRELGRPFQRRPKDAGPPTPVETTGKAAKPSKAERRAQAWQSWLDLPEGPRQHSASLGWELSPEFCRSFMERTTEGERFLFAGCTIRSLALAAMLKEKGCPCTVMGAPVSIRKLSREGLTLETAALAERLRYESEFTAAFDHLVLDAAFLDELDTLARLQLWPAQRLWLLHASGEHDALRDVVDGAMETHVAGLLHFDHAPRALLHPDWTFRNGHDRSSWPLPEDEKTRYEPCMPSGKPWPRITVVTVTRNQGHYIRETLDSVLSQAYPNLEYLVFDGASTDDTPGILEEYRPHLAYAISEPDKGQSDALNRAFARSTGEIMTWLNSDDRLLPGALKRVALAFDASPQADMVAGGCALVNESAARAYHVHHCCFPRSSCSRLPLERVLDLDGSWFKGDFFMQPEVFWRRSLWERAGAHMDVGLHYNMDYELFARFAAAGAVVFHLPESLCLFRMHAAQKTHGEKPFIPEARRVRDQLATQYLSASTPATA